MKYVYVVSRKVTGKWSESYVPNLGVHTNFRRAKSHFDDVVSDRLNKLKMNGKLIYNRLLPKERDYPDDKICEAFIAFADGYEHIYIERWPLR